MYISRRPSLLGSFVKLYDEGIKKGTKGRVVIWMISDIENDFSTMLLTELGLDISNFCHWRYKFVPGIIRVGLSRGDSHSNKVIQQFLTNLSIQYFDLPQFNVKRDIDNIGDVAIDQGFNLNQSARIGSTQPFAIRGNPYDITLLFDRLDTFVELLNRILKIHVMESQYINKNRSAILGSGGQLYLVQSKLISSYSPWRRLDWLTLAQTDFMPRLWMMSKEASRKEFYELLDYRFWRGRFSYLFEEETLDEADLEKMIISYPDSKGVDIYLRDNDQFKRRRRERNWNKLLATFESSNSMDKLDLQYSQESIVDSGSSDYSISLEESNMYRITKGDYASFKELAYYFQKEKLFHESLAIIELGKPELDIGDELYKLKGISLLNLGKNQEGSDILKNYRRKLLKNLEDALLLGKDIDISEKAQTWSEVSAVALVDGDHKEALEYSLKSLDIFSDNISTLKTFIWASVVTGISSCKEMDLVFSFFVNSLGNIEKTKEYYELVTQKHPDNGYFLFGYAMFLYIQNENKKAGELFEKAYQMIPNDPRLLESYASFLFQTNNLDMKVRINEMYLMALKLDPLNLATKSNASSFLLHIGEIEKGLSMLEEVLYAEDLYLKNPQVYLEAWFYSFCYIDSAEKRYESLRQLKFALIKGIRAPLWDLSMHVNRYKIDSERSWVLKLSKVIQSDAHITELSKWERWAKTPASNLLKSTPSNLSQLSISTPEPQTSSPTFPQFFTRKKSNDLSELKAEPISPSVLNDKDQDNTAKDKSNSDIFSFSTEEILNRDGNLEGNEDLPKPKKVFTRRKK